jgi:hypothetical protein
MAPMNDEPSFTDEEIAVGIAEATGVDLPRARFMLGLQRGQTTGDIAVVGGAHADPPLVELSSIAAEIVRTEAGALVAMLPGGLRGRTVWTEGIVTLAR